MIDIITRFSFLLIGAFTVSTFFGGITEDIIVAGISAIITVIVGILIAIFYKWKKNRPMIQ